MSVTSQNIVPEPLERYAAFSSLCVCVCVFVCACACDCVRSVCGVLTKQPLCSVCQTISDTCYHIVSS